MFKSSVITDITSSAEAGLHSDCILDMISTYRFILLSNWTRSDSNERLIMLGKMHDCDQMLDYAYQRLRPQGQVPGARRLCYGHGETIGTYNQHRSAV